MTNVIINSNLFNQLSPRVSFLWIYLLLTFCRWLCFSHLWSIAHSCPREKICKPTGSAFSFYFFPSSEPNVFFLSILGKPCSSIALNKAFHFLSLSFFILSYQYFPNRLFSSTCKAALLFPRFGNFSLPWLHIPYQQKFSINFSRKLVTFLTSTFWHHITSHTTTTWLSPMPIHQPPQ